MSFSADLLDGFDGLNKRTEGVLKTCGNVSEFFRALSKIEKDYSKELKALAQKQKISFQKASTTQKELATTSSSWDTILTELEKISEHHRQYSDTIANDLATPVEKWCREKQTTRKKLENDSERIRKDMRYQLDNLAKARSKYVSQSKEADSCESVHTKGKGDINMKPGALAKLAQKASQAADKAAVGDTEYQACLSQTNQKQTEFYLSIQPALLGEFQQFEEDRLQYMKSIIEKFADVHAETPGFYTTASDTITAAARAISIDSDIQAFVGENRTNVTPPPDIQYIPYDSELPSTPGKAKPSHSASPSARQGAPNGSGKGKAYGGYNKADNDILSSREWGLSASDRNLSPEDQRIKLHAQLEELDKAITSETKSKEGLENLVRFYSSDPVAQKKAEDEITDCEQKLSRYHETRYTVQSALNSIGGRAVQVRGLYAYEATCETELSFREGDLLTVTEQDDSGWWYAELNGKAGFVPNNYVKLVE